MSKKIIENKVKINLEVMKKVVSLHSQFDGEKHKKKFFDSI